MVWFLRLPSSILALWIMAFNYLNSAWVTASALFPGSLVPAFYTPILVPTSVALWICEIWARPDSEYRKNFDSLGGKRR